MDASKTFGKTENKVSKASVVSNAKKVCKTVISKIIKPNSKSDIDYNNGNIKKEWNLDLDLEVHEEIKSYKCYLSGKKINHFCDVQKHVIDLDYQCFDLDLEVHEEEKPYKCYVSETVKPPIGQFKNNDTDNNSPPYKYVIMEVHEGKEQYKCELCNVKFINLCDVQKHLLDLNFECFLVDNFLMPPLTNMGEAVLQEVEISRHGLL